MEDPVRLNRIAPVTFGEGFIKSYKPVRESMKRIKCETVLRKLTTEYREKEGKEKNKQISRFIDKNRL